MLPLFFFNKVGYKINTFESKQHNFKCVDKKKQILAT